MKVFRRFLSINQISQGFSVSTLNSRIILLNRDSYPKDNFDCVSFQIWFRSRHDIFSFRSFRHCERDKYIPDISVFFDWFFSKNQDH